MEGIRAGKLRGGVGRAYELMQRQRQRGEGIQADELRCSVERVYL